jgi:cell division protein FtsW
MNPRRREKLNRRPSKISRNNKASLMSRNQGITRPRNPRVTNGGGRPQKKVSLWDRRQNTRKNNSESFWTTLFDFRFNHDKRIALVFITLLIIGIIAIFSASITFGYTLRANKFYFLFQQIKFIIVGFVGLSVFYFIKPYIFVRFWFVPLFVSIALLGYLLIMSLMGAEGVNGANRWLDIGGFSFQPSDFAKLSFVIFVAAFLSNKKNHYKDFQEYLKTNFIPYSFWFFLILFLILIGNSNLGTAVVIGFIGVTCYGVSATTKYHRIGLGILIGLILIGGAAFALHERYRMDRVAVWSNYWSTGDSRMDDKNCPNRVGCWYQYDLVLTSLGTGGFSGIGAGQSTGKYYFVQTTAGDDSIIGIIGEEWGFIVTVGILLLYLYLVLTCISIARDFVDKPIYFFLMVGCSCWIGFQAFVHYGANIGVIPLTGQTLPFISLGGSSLFCLMCAMGLILNVSKQRENVDI